MLAVIVSFLALGLPSTSVADTVFAFRHPGALNTDSSLDMARSRIAQHQAPWSNALIEVERKAQPAGPALTAVDARDQNQASTSKWEAEKAYANALAWRLTGDQIYARQAVAILNRWADFQGFVGGTDQDRLHAGWIGVLFGEAAEIMRSSPDWPSSDVAAFQAMFRRAFYPQLTVASRWNGNVDLTQIDALMTIAVSNDDSVAFERGLQRLQTRLPAYIYLESDSAIAPIDGDGGNIDAFWFHPTRWVDGLTQETCRDNGHHAQFGLASALHAAEIAWNQGVDVYATHEKRFTSAMELMARQLLTGDMQGTCSNGSATGVVFDTFEVGFNHYHNRRGHALPYTEKLIIERVRPHGVSELNIFQESLTHARPSAPAESLRSDQKE
ncbi:secreted protein [Asticcacaulis biprosthecium C19]|uniref:Secreted protein n=1 Tax=Asticcacaulis biprosthecium C19 TaxID=715226 RepID=F4QU11_9CAUL|nr:alginate lyase family protein [Asticcacaulis biprosthecium]EGF89311.1 secreted protein [Asticcacaulis biprosthecium C19]